MVISIKEHTAEDMFVPEPEPEVESDLVCEPVPVSVPVGVLIEYKGMEPRPRY